MPYRVILLVEEANIDDRRDRRKAAEKLLGKAVAVVDLGGLMR